MAMESESPPPEPQPNPLSAAEQIACLADLPSIIFRRFDKLAIENILELHSQLTQIDNLANATLGGDKRRMIEQYHTAIVLYSEVLKLSKPPVGYVRDLHKILREKENDHTWAIWDAKSLPERPYSDLVAVSAYDDPLTRFISSSYLQFLFVDVIQSLKRGETVIDHTRICRFVTFLQAVVSIGFLVGAMWALWSLHDDMVARLATVTSFVGAFCLWLAFCTGLLKREVFAATAAYAAVLVVYVGSTGNPGQTIQGGASS